MRYRGRVSYPITVRAHVLSQQEKDNLPEWRPEGMIDLELRGTNNSNSFPQNTNLKVVERKPPTELKGTTNITHHFESKTSEGGTGSTNQDPALIQGLTQDPTFLNQHPMHGQYFADDSGFPFGDFTEMSNFSTMIQDILEPTGEAMMPHSGAGFGINQQTPIIKTEHQGGHFTAPVHCKLQVPAQECEELLVHEFEFANLEFIKPTRMSKVYICFACTILDYDVLYCVYHIPTVGICRAEQRAKACEKLTIPMSFLECGNCDSMTSEHSRSEASVHSGGGGGKPQGGRGQEETVQHIDSFHRTGLEAVGESETSHVDGFNQRTNYSRQALHEWINEEYKQTGLKRKLTTLDLQTLEAQAGLVNDSSFLTQSQWSEFTTQFREVLKMLKKIGGLWDCEDPCVIAGLHLDRTGTIQAMSGQPAGTFLCRLSWSTPGTLVLSCKVQPTMAKADPDGLVHIAISKEDLQMRKLDTWIRDLPAALHVLDIYTQKRVDKRKVFHSNYHRMRQFEGGEF